MPIILAVVIYGLGGPAAVLACIVHAIASLTPIDLLEWTGALLGLLGAYLLATHSRISRYGWIAFLAANIATILFAYAIGKHGLLTQQVGFVGSSLLGLKRAGLLMRRKGAAIGAHLANDHVTRCSGDATP